MLACAVPEPGARWVLHEILVVDNNPDGSARPVVAELAAEAHPVPEGGPTITYRHEPTPGIVAARNRALSDAAGDVLVFLDDDEVALPGWPGGLLDVMAETGAALVGGPVLSEFLEPPDDWVIESRFFANRQSEHGSVQSWLRTGNLALDLDEIRTVGLRFDPRYPHGEDATFSLLAARSGLELRWSSTAPVKELVGPERTTIAWRRTRHRISTDAWYRAQLDLDPSLATQARLLATAGSRLVQGVATYVAGVVAQRLALRYAGLALMSQARGGLDGLAAHRRERADLTASAGG